jgi:hypothetical protein
VEAGVLERLAHAALLLTALLAALSAAASLSWPFGWDQGVFAQVGDVIVRGGLPYRDGWDVKGPLVYYLLALSQTVLGVNQWGIRVLDLGLLAGGAWSLSRIVTVLSSPTTGRWAGLGFSLLYLSGGYWDTAQPDGWVAVLVCLAALVVVPTGRLGGLRCGAAGVIIGLCALMKWLYAGFLLLPLLAVVLDRPSDRGGWLRRMTSVVGAFLGPILITALWFAAHGALHDAVEAQFTYPAAVNGRQFGVTALSLAVRARGVAQFFLRPQVLAAAPAVVVGLLTLWKSRRDMALLLSAWIGIGLGCVLAQARFVDYQWLPLFPPLVVLCAVGLDSVRAGPGRILALSTAAVLMTSVALGPARSAMRWSGRLVGAATSEEYYDHYFRQASAGMKAADYLRAHSSERDRIAVWGSNAGILYLSRRPSATRFGTYDPVVRGDGAPILLRYREEYLRTLQAQRPRYFVVSTQDLSDTVTPADLRGFPELLAFVAEHYDMVKELGGGVTILRRRD